MTVALGFSPFHYPHLFVVGLAFLSRLKSPAARRKVRETSENRQRTAFPSPVRGVISVVTVSLLILQAPEERHIPADQGAISPRRSLKIIVGRFFLQIARP